jgi:membrane-associated protease RseP (regulator of RpoE activity)
MTRNTRTYLIQAILFLLTIITTTYCGAEWLGYSNLEFSDFFWSGLNYSIPFLSILTIHEFGHYFCARKYGVETSLPYYIPLPIPGTIGTLGAFIRMKGQASSKRAMFDIGIAGPLAGFVAALIILVYGFTHLPERDYIFKIHPSYAEYNGDYAKEVYTYAHIRKEDSLYHEAVMQRDSLQFVADKKSGKTDVGQWERSAFKPQEVYSIMSLGDNILFKLLSKVLVSDESLLPNAFELIHYPLLFAGYLALFFTALNLLPIGQLDGGHVIYGLFGYRRHRMISISFFTLFVTLAGVGIFKDNLLGINFFNAEPIEMLLFAAAYIYFLYSMYEQFFKNNKTTAVLIATSIFAAQFLVEYMIPSWHGFSGWMVFAYIVGRFLGLEHPPAAIEQPLDWKRKVLGWLALVIFVVCFTPEVFNIKLLTP